MGYVPRCEWCGREVAEVDPVADIGESVVHLARRFAGRWWGMSCITLGGDAEWWILCVMTDAAGEIVDGCYLASDTEWRIGSGAGAV